LENLSNRMNLKEVLNNKQILVKKILEKSEAQLKETSEINQLCVDQFVKKLSTNKSKLQTIFNEVQKQLNVINNLIFSLKEKHKNLMDNIQLSKSNSQDLLTNLNLIFGKLKNTPLSNEFALISKSLENTIEKKYLFDYVNVESVEILKSKAKEEIGELEKLKDLVINLLDDINVPYNNILENSRKLFENVDTINFVLDHETFNQMEMKELGKLVLEIAGKHDKIQYLLSNPSMLATVDIKECDSIEPFLESRQKSIVEIIKKINENCNQVEEKFKFFSDFYKTLREVFNELEKISPLVPNKLSSMDGIESNFHQRISASRNTFEEINDLTTWYNLFLISYNQLLLEVDRRNKFNFQMDKMIFDLSKKFNDFYNGELI
jgi:hypothetical protein